MGKSAHGCSVGKDGPQRQSCFGPNARLPRESASRVGHGSPKALDRRFSNGATPILKRKRVWVSYDPLLQGKNELWTGVRATRQKSAYAELNRKPQITETVVFAECSATHTLRKPTVDFERLQASVVLFFYQVVELSGNKVSRGRRWLQTIYEL